ncbi:MAG: alpha/beta hydrolase [Rickettsiales bacterium]|jgi:pimeloyl-ACP methyl ester carboxylesterase|nr:alpha/beta hydrolase [Rickettsiales bacterium]
MEQKFFLSNEQYFTYKILDNESVEDFDILFLHGFYGNMDGGKGLLLEKLAAENKLNLMKLNYLGHGTSSGKVTDFTLTDWFGNVKTFIDNFSDKKLLLVGSSMGGWLSCLTALEYKDKIKGVLTCSTAVDFLEEVIEPLIEEKNKEKDVVFEIINPNGDSSGNFVTKKLIEDSRKYGLLSKDKIELNCPVRMVHGMEDMLIPYKVFLKFVDKLHSEDMEVKIVRKMDHRLSLEGNLDIFCNYLNEIIRLCRIGNSLSAH